MRRTHSEKDQGLDETSILIQGKSKELIVATYQTEGSSLDITVRTRVFCPKMDMLHGDLALVRGLEEAM